MIVRCNQKDENKIVSYIGNNHPRCLYLFLDLKKYGLVSDSVEVYVQIRRESIESVLLKYYSCLHVYSENNSFDAEELAAFIEQRQFTIIYSHEATSRCIYASLSGKVKERATITTGWVAQIKKIDKNPRGLSLPAIKEDFQQIVELIYEDEDIGRSYNYSELARQIEERNKEGYARNIVIKQGDLVVAHACTNAELENIAVVAELIVRKEFRGKGYASEIWRDICGRLLSEGKEVYSFYYSEESRNLHKHIGFSEVCEWAKVVIDWSR